MNIRAGTTKADAHYQKLLCINHLSIGALRSYANFLEHVVHDEDRATQYAIEAQRIEDQRSKVRNVHFLQQRCLASAPGGNAQESHDEGTKVKLLQPSTLDVMSDSIAMVTIGEEVELWPLFTTVFLHALPLRTLQCGGGRWHARHAGHHYFL